MTDHDHTAASRPRIPGPASLPVVGNLFDVLGASQETTIEFAEDYHARYGPIFALDVMGRRQIFASNHRLVAQMCSSPLWTKAVHDALEEIRRFGGDGLFTAYNEEPNWGKAHRLLMPAFGTMAMRDYFPQMLDIAEQMMVRWERFGPDHTIDVAEDMTRLTLDTIALCAFDVRFNSFYSDRPHPFVEAMVRALTEAGERTERLPGVQPLLLGTNRRYRDDIATMREITERIVASRAARPADERPDDLLERMLSAADPLTGEKLSEENVRYQMATFLIAGHETTSGLLSFATHELLAHPDVLARVRSAVDEVLGDRTPRFEDLARLGYLGQILRETLRLHPTAPAFALSPGEPTTLGGFDLAPADPDYEMTISESLTIKPKDLTVRARPRVSASRVRTQSGTGPSAARPDAPVATAARPPHGTPLLVLFGSNGGSSESLARTVAADGRARGWNTEAAPLDEYAGALPTDRPVVVVTSSYNGNPPDNAGRFVDWLTHVDPDLHGVDYLVLGCGSLDWAATYQRIPTLVDDAMSAAGATRIRERGTIDARTDFFGDWESWYRPLWAELAARYGLEGTEPTGPRYRVTPADGTGGERDGTTATVLANRELVRGASGRSKRHLELRLPEETTYRTGDYLSVLPRNHPDLVTRMTTRLGIGADDVVTVHSEAPGGRVPVGTPVRVDDLLTRCVDLSAPATPGVVAALAQTTKCPPERAELDNLAGPDHAERVLGRRLSLLDLLEMFPSCLVDLAWVLERLPEPRARQYSISSAAEAQTDVALTVSVVEGPAPSGRGVHRGAASDYLRRARPGDRLTVALASPHETFRPPADNAAPVVMIAAGSGIAPFRAFVQARHARAQRGEGQGENVLFFGCRHPEEDDLYAEEFAPCEAAGTLRVHRAYSRRPDGGIRYVQHRLWAERAAVLDLVERGAHVYVCGDAAGMGPAVEETLARIGRDGHGPDWLPCLAAGGRYATDLF